ncbi:hypothetical protein FDX19_20910 [Citrobacter sp. wls619]|uniref:hypothetical protein n=1 Tax=Citrobacter sp. wls619 TaxID=2576432 RepID=UPI0010C98D75|nr:hypothetical protein [Citrobacter sp. wls619]TKV06435.1 hypothetical protein FDX19_20910 [Citrobacter sp. wls619]
MGSFFTVVDDPKNQRVFLYRADEAIDNAIYLDTDPTGTVIPFPDVLDKVDMGSATNKAGFIIPYKDGVKLKIGTNLPSTGSIGDTLTLTWTSGVMPYEVKTVDESTGTLYDAVNQQAKTYSFNTTGKAAGDYVITVKDANGAIVESSPCTIS